MSTVASLTSVITKSLSTRMMGVAVFRAWRRNQRLELGDLALSHVGGVLHHLVDSPVLVQNRTVGGLDEDRVPRLAKALEAPALGFSAGQRAPEVQVGLFLPRGGRHQHPVMLALNFLQLVAHHAQEIGIGVLHHAVDRELDDGVVIVDRLDLGFVVQHGLSSPGVRRPLGRPRSSDVRGAWLGAPGGRPLQGSSSGCPPGPTGPG